MLNKKTKKYMRKTKRLQSNVFNVFDKDDAAISSEDGSFTSSSKSLKNYKK